ncbi:Rv3235 family protein [Nocardia sp. NPDC057353]|uniref:Rv3235 family protein n=1 Tax=Nocardia sp. NPDC057353 TaxID=3346104 RepID=UPI0036354825
MESRVSVSCAPHGEPPLRRLRPRPRGVVAAEGVPRAQAGQAPPGATAPRTTTAEGTRAGAPSRATRPVPEAGAPARRQANSVRSRRQAPPCAPGRPATPSRAERNPASSRAERNPAPSRAERDAQLFAERALRLVLETLDGRRRAMHLRDIADPEVVAVLETYARTSVRERKLGAAALKKVSCAPGAHGRVEVFGRYHRGDRAFAIAACLRAHRGGWRLGALRVR